jgi:hypothetical protein
MATMVEFAQRMLTNRPTVARTSERPIWLTARSPTRASDPRTEITRPKDVTVIEPGFRIWVRTSLWTRVVGETVKPRRFRVRQIRDILVRISLWGIATAGLDRGILPAKPRFFDAVPLALVSGSA